MGLLQVGLSNCVMALALAALAASVGRWSRRPAVAHGLWLLVLLKLVTPPLVTVPIPWPEPEGPARPVALAALPEAPAIPEALAPVSREAPVEAPPPPASAPTGRPEPVAPEDGALAPLPPEPPPERPEPPAAPALPAAALAPEDAGLPWPLLAGAVWLGGSCCWFAVAGRRIRRFSRLLAHAAPAPAALQEEAEALAARLGLARCPRVWLVPGAVSPMVWALGGAARLLMPEGLLARLGAEQRATLLAHELAHLRRRDHWVRMLELLVLGLYWWFPLAWWARRELHEAEEACCDAWVVWALPDSLRAYATALVETLDFLCGARPALPPAASGVGPLPLLRRRLTMIMRGSTPRTLTGAGFLALCGLGVVLLPLVPSWAQAPTREPGVGRAPADPNQALVGIDLQKARADLKRMAYELDALRKNLDAKSAAVKQQLDQLQRGEEKPHRAGRRAPGAAPELKPAGRDPRAPPPVRVSPSPRPTPANPAGGAADLPKRLADVEHKLDLVLTELVSLRHELAKRKPGMGGQGGQGGQGGRPLNVPPVLPPGSRGGRGAGGPDSTPRPVLPPNPRLVPGTAPVDPAPEQVQGKVLKVDPKDPKLVQISIGSDAGVKAGQTLEVYRLRPEPRYLGKICIINSANGRAVGRSMERPVVQIQIGDEVASQIH